MVLDQKLIAIKFRSTEHRSTSSNIIQRVAKHVQHVEWCLMGMLHPFVQSLSVLYFMKFVTCKKNFPDKLKIA